MQNTRQAALFILALFFIWGGISWYWYTCGVKGFCEKKSDTVTIPTAPEPIHTRDPLVLPIVETPEIFVREVPILEIPCAPYLTRTISTRGPNNRMDVVKLQLFLTRHTGASLTVTGTYNAATVAAVKKFQAQYASEILAPYRLTRPTGNVGYATREKINDVVCASTSDKVY